MSSGRSAPRAVAHARLVVAVHLAAAGCGQLPAAPVSSASSNSAGASTPKPGLEDSQKNDLAPAPTAPAWWCACYARTGPEPATACRSSRDACERLQRKAHRGGGNSIVPGSLTHVCREIRAAHPGDVLGSRDVWQPADRPGNWISPGACLLPGPPDAPPAPVHAADAKDPSALLAGERLGDLRLGHLDADILTALGPPARRGAAQLSQATGSFEQLWIYPARGLELRFDAPTHRGPYTLAAIRAAAPCALRTARGVGIGDPYAAVKDAYGEERDPDADPDRGLFVVGTLDFGVIFTFDRDTRTVTEIFFGAAAE